MNILLICDESVKIKNRKAKQTKATKRIAAKYRLALSGYPIHNNIVDIWSQVDWMQPGYLGSYWGFEDLYVQSIPIKIPGKREFKKVIGYKNLDNLKVKLDPLYIRRLKSETLDLPPKIHETREVEMDREQRHAYESMRDTMRVLIESMTADEVIAKASTIMTQLMRLSQITDGFLTDPNLEKPKFFEKNAKLNALNDIVDEITSNQRKIVIWSRFLPILYRINDLYKDKFGVVIITGDVPHRMREQAVDSFQNDSKTNIFLGQLESGGMGITLTAASVQVFLNKGFTAPASILQAEDRLHRISQKNTVVIISLVAKNTVDEHWQKLVERKQKVARELLRDTEKIDLGKQEFLDLLQ